MLTKFKAKRAAVRLEAAKAREKQIQDERAKRNQERMLAKQKVVANTFKRQMFRSPQPGVSRVEKKVVEDTEKNDFLKFLGTSLSTFDDE